MAFVDKTAASIGFHGDDLDPDEITRALGQPSWAAKKGDILLSPSGEKITSPSGIWLLEVEEAEPEELDRQISDMFASLSDDLGIWKDLTARYQAKISAGLFLSRYNEGLGISPKTLSAIGARGLQLDFDIHGGNDDGEEEEWVVGYVRK